MELKITADVSPPANAVTDAIMIIAMIGKIRLWIIAASIISLPALGAVSWLSYRNTKELIAANQRLAQAHKLVEDLAVYT